MDGKVVRLTTSERPQDVESPTDELGKDSRLRKCTDG
jgi:hypothetical protein